MEGEYGVDETQYQKESVDRSWARCVAYATKRIITKTHAWELVATVRGEPPVVMRG